jgi:hypothetical protein
MAASTRGLSPADLAAITGALAAGKRPKVVFTASAGQMAGNTGQVVRLDDPTTSDEWIVVRFGRDELPFAPADLAIPVRAVAVRAKPEPTAAVPLAAPAPPPRASRVTLPEPEPKQGRPVEVKVEAKPEPAKEPEAPKKVPKPKTPTSFVVTLTYTDREWTIAANLGSRALAKPFAIKPTEALRMVALIDVPGVHDAVEGIIAAERADAETRAQRLRAELADIESRLAELTGR